jgi:hypothetical protein
VADPNRALFESVVRLLAPVLDELVFVGGCKTGSFITDPAAGGMMRCGRERRRRRARRSPASVARVQSLSVLDDGTGPKCRFANARPDPDLRYLSKRAARDPSGDSSDTTTDHGRWCLV